MTWPQDKGVWREITNSLVVSYKDDTICLVSRVVYIRTLIGLLEETLIAIVSMSREEKALAFLR